MSKKREKFDLLFYTKLLWIFLAENQTGHHEFMDMGITVTQILLQNVNES